MFKFNWLRKLIAEEVNRVAIDLEKAHREITAREAEVLTSIEDKRVQVETSFHATVKTFFPGLTEILASIAAVESHVKILASLGAIETSTSYLAEAERKSLQRSGHNF